MRVQLLPILQARVPARTYALVLVAAGVSLFLAVVGANVVIDPQGVFGTGLLPRSPNINDRYQRFLAYRAAPEKYDGLIFGSSRAANLPLDELARRTGAAHFANFGVIGGSLADHVPTLQYILRDQASRGERVRVIFLMLDADALVNRPFTNGGLQYTLPPAISGESPARFWWKNLTAIQVKAWNSAIRNAATVRSATTPRVLFLGSAVAAALDALQPSRTVAQPLATTQGAPAKPPKLRQVAARPELSQHLEWLKTFLALCRRENIKLHAALAPLHPTIVAEYEPTDLAKIAERVARIVPVWDFTSSEELWARSDLWVDNSHFRAEVGRLMLRRMFGEELPEPWRQFGRFHSN